MWTDRLIFFSGTLNILRQLYMCICLPFAQNHSGTLKIITFFLVQVFFGGRGRGGVVMRIALMYLLKSSYLSSFLKISLSSQNDQRDILMWIVQIRWCMNQNWNETMLCRNWFDLYTIIVGERQKGGLSNNIIGRCGLS